MKSSLGYGLLLFLDGECYGMQNDMYPRMRTSWKWLCESPATWITFSSHFHCIWNLLPLKHSHCDVKLPNCQMERSQAGEKVNFYRPTLGRATCLLSRVLLLLLYVELILVQHMARLDANSVQVYLSGPYLNNIEARF